MQIKNNHKHKPRAFTLTEMVITVTIVAVVLSGVLLANNLITKSRVAAAKALTLSSPVNTINGLSFWLESNSDNSFDTSEAENSKAITTWYDRGTSVVKNNAVQVSVVNKPIYRSNSINRINAVSFDGTNSYLTVNGSFLNNKNYTIFITEKRSSNKADNYFIGDSSNTTQD